MPWLRTCVAALAVVLTAQTSIHPMIKQSPQAVKENSLESAPLEIGDDINKLGYEADNDKIIWQKLGYHTPQDVDVGTPVKEGISQSLYGNTISRTLLKARSRRDSALATAYKPLFRGRYRGQTQSQYLNIGESSPPGKAEAESGPEGSRAVVSGNRGMGQAQSQSGFSSGCEDCDTQSQKIAYGGDYNVDPGERNHGYLRVPGTNTDGRIPGRGIGGLPTDSGPRGTGQLYPSGFEKPGQGGHGRRPGSFAQGGQGPAIGPQGSGGQGQEKGFGAQGGPGLSPGIYTSEETGQRPGIFTQDGRGQTPGSYTQGGQGPLNQGGENGRPAVNGEGGKIPGYKTQDGHIPGSRLHTLDRPGQSPDSYSQGGQGPRPGTYTQDGQGRRPGIYTQDGQGQIPGTHAQDGQRQRPPGVYPQDRQDQMPGTYTQGRQGHIPGTHTPDGGQGPDRGQQNVDRQGVYPIGGQGQKPGIHDEQGLIPGLNIQDNLNLRPAPQNEGGEGQDIDTYIDGRRGQRIGGLPQDGQTHRPSTYTPGGPSQIPGLNLEDGQRPGLKIEGPPVQVPGTYDQNQRPGIYSPDGQVQRPGPYSKGGQGQIPYDYTEGGQGQRPGIHTHRIQDLQPGIGNKGEQGQRPGIYGPSEGRYGGEHGQTSEKYGPEDQFSGPHIQDGHGQRPGAYVHGGQGQLPRQHIEDRRGQRPGTYNQDGQSQRPGAYSQDGQRQRPGSFTQDELGQRPGTYTQDGRGQRPGSFTQDELGQRPGTYTQNGQSQRPGSFTQDGLGKRPPTYTQDGQGQGPGSFTQDGLGQRPGTYTQDGQGQEPGSFTQDGLGQRPGTYTQDGQGQRPGTHLHGGQVTRPGEYTQDGKGQRPGAYSLDGQGQRPGSYTQDGLGQRPGKYTQDGQGQRPGTYIQRGQGQRPATHLQGGQGQIPGAYEQRYDGQEPGPYSQDRQGQRPGTYTQDGQDQRPGTYAPDVQSQTPVEYTQGGQGTYTHDGEGQRPGAYTQDREGQRPRTDTQDGQGSRPGEYTQDTSGQRKFPNDLTFSQQIGENTYSSGQDFSKGGYGVTTPGADINNAWRGQYPGRQPSNQRYPVETPSIPLGPGRQPTYSQYDRDSGRQDTYPPGQNTDRYGTRLEKYAPGSSKQGNKDTLYDSQKGDYPIGPGGFDQYLPETNQQLRPGIPLDISNGQTYPYNTDTYPTQTGEGNYHGQPGPYSKIPQTYIPGTSTGTVYEKGTNAFGKPTDGEITDGYGSRTDGYPGRGDSSRYADNLPPYTDTSYPTNTYGNTGDKSQHGQEILENDDSNSQAETSIQKIQNGTQASASSVGTHGGGSAQSQITGSYTGSGSFSAQAQTIDANRGAQSQISVGKDGATSNAQGKAGRGQSQAQLQLTSETGAIVAEAQSGGWNHGTNTQVQASSQGGLADAQANGPGSTSSQAQIGFQPHKEGAVEDDKSDSPFYGGGTASAQSGNYAGQSQTQIQGKFKYGISYNGAAQAGSGIKDLLSKNRTSMKPFDVFAPKTIRTDRQTSQLDFKENEEKTPIEKTVKEAMEESETKNLDQTHINHDASHITNGASNINHDASHINHGASNIHGTSHINHGTSHINHGVSRINHGISHNLINTTENTLLPSSKNDMIDVDDIDAKDTQNIEDYEDIEEDEYDSDFDPSTEATHQSVKVINQPQNVVFQQTGHGQKQHILLGSLDKSGIHIVKDSSSDTLKEGMTFQPGEIIPGTQGYTIPIGFRGRVSSVSKGDETFAFADENGDSQAQSITLTPGAGNITYTKPVPSPQPNVKNINSHNSRSLVIPERPRNNLNPKRRKDQDSYVTVTKTVAGELNADQSDLLEDKKFSHTYYSKSSTCGYFTFTCNLVYGSNGRTKICKPNIPKNPDGSPVQC